MRFEFREETLSSTKIHDHMDIEISLDLSDFSMKVKRRKMILIKKKTYFQSERAL